MLRRLVILSLAGMCAFSSAFAETSAIKKLEKRIAKLEKLLKVKEGVSTKSKNNVISDLKEEVERLASFVDLVPSSFLKGKWLARTTAFSQYGYFIYSDVTGEFNPTSETEGTWVSEPVPIYSQSFPSDNPSSILPLGEWSGFYRIIDDYIYFFDTVPPIPLPPSFNGTKPHTLRGICSLKRNMTALRLGCGQILYRLEE